MFFNHKGNQMKQNKMFLIGLFVLIAACTKEAPYQYEFKNEVKTKSQIDNSSDYIYNASIQQISKHSSNGFPHYFGDNKRVRLEWTEKSLRVVEKERDQRFSSEVNDKLILEIPVEHVDFECAKDAYGNCTNKEVAKDAKWQDKGSFKIKPAEAKQGALEILPILLDQALGSTCFQEVSSVVQGYEITNDAINIQIKRNYNQNIDCLEKIENSLTETSMSVVFHYSMVKASSVLSPDFKPFDYSKIDENTFGFFSSTYKERDVDHNSVENAEKTVMHHWNPNRSTIDFHLSDNFNKPQHRKLKEVTYLAIERMNQGLADSGVKFRINLHEPSGKNPGDIRNSMIILAEDPAESGPLGYGPQTEDPLTGEIISARTVMFMSGFQQYAKINYEDLGRTIKRHKQKALAEKAEKAKQQELDQADHGLILEDGLVEELQKQQQLFKKATDQSLKATNQKIPQKNRNNFQGVNKVRLEKEIESLKTPTDRISDEYSARDTKSYIKYLTEAKNCTLKLDSLSGLSEVRPELMQQLVDQFGDKDGNLKPWKDLSRTEKQAVLDLLIPEVYLPTLLHELGHNLGLRHNFKASEDKDNWYSEQELKEAGVNHEIPYSSVMEYGDDLRSLTFLGKYDIAALRYAYARQVEVKDAAGAKQLVSVTHNLSQLQKDLAEKKMTISEFGYCTDENVGPNPGCRRFDEGVTYTEITQYLINSYYDRFDLRSTRSGRDIFSSLDDLAHAVRTYNRFLDMRTVAETYERIKNNYGLSDDHQIWSTNEFLKDIKTATLMVNRFLLDIVKTPSMHCAIQDQKSGEVFIAAINRLDKDAYDCWTAGVNDNYRVIAQTGRQLNSKKHPDNQSSYIDQIDVRGFWLDKWAASRALFARNLSHSHNRYFDNAWDIAELKPEIQELVIGTTTNKLIQESDFQMIDGRVQKVPFRYDFHEAHLIEQPLNRFLPRVLGVPQGNIYFSEVLAGAIKKEAGSNVDNLLEGRALADLVTVKASSDLDQTPEMSGLRNVKLGSFIIYAGETNVAGQLLIDDYMFQTKLGSISDETLAALNTYLQEVAKANSEKANSVEVTAESLKKRVAELTVLPEGQNLVELTEQQVELLVKMAEKDLDKLTNQTSELSRGLMMTPDQIAKVLISLN